MSEGDRGVRGRPRINYEQMPARFPEGTLGRIDEALLPGETRADFLRKAVASLLAERAANAVESGYVEDKAYALQALGRMEAARNFPDNTCPSSRHAQMCAEFLVRDGVYHLIADEPAHVGGSIASTVAALYEARSFLGALGYAWEVGADGVWGWSKVSVEGSVSV